MNHETPAKRRTRLIEQYAGLLEAGPTYRANVIASAIELADAVIAATPQESEPTSNELPLISLCHDAARLMKLTDYEGFAVNQKDLSIWLKSWESLKLELGVK